MTISTRTDYNTHINKNIAIKAQTTTRTHTDAILAMEYIKLQTFKKEGASCSSCIFHSKERYYDFCSKPEKRRKQVNPLAICATYTKRVF